MVNEVCVTWRWLMRQRQKLEWGLANSLDLARQVTQTPFTLNLPSLSISARLFCPQNAPIELPAEEATLPCGCITSFVKFSWSCLGSFDFVRAGKFRVFTVLNTMMISKFLEPIYQSLSNVCVAVGAHTKPVFQATSHPTIPSSICRVAWKTNISGSCRINRRGSKTTDFISCIPDHCGHKYGLNELNLARRHQICRKYLVSFVYKFRPSVWLSWTATALANESSFFSLTSLWTLS